MDGQFGSIDWMTCVAQTDGLHEEQVEVTNSPAADPGALQDVPSVWLQCPMIERVHDPVIIERIARNEEGLWSAAIGWRVFFEGFGKFLLNSSLGILRRRGWR